MFNYLLQDLIKAGFQLSKHAVCMCTHILILATTSHFENWETLTNYLHCFSLLSSVGFNMNSCSFSFDLIRPCKHQKRIHDCRKIPTDIIIRI